MENSHPIFHLRMTKDKMAVHLDCFVPSYSLDPLAEAIQKELLALGVSEPPHVRDIKLKLRRAAAEGPHLKDMVLLEGYPPTPPVDSKIVWAGDFFNTGFVVDPKTGTIDYRSRAAQVSVAENQLLAKVIPPKEGTPGMNVLGKEIPAIKPQKRRIRVGNNVRFDKEEGAFYATTSGRIRWVNYLLFVDPVYSVPGCVGLETGHISHPGAVLVEEDVLEGAKVETGGDIEVKGVIEAADVRTSGNLTVRGGITRSDGHRIVVAGSVHARFILDADVEAGGDIVVESEIVNSRVKARGGIIMPKGRIVGGKVSAYRGVMVGQIGSRAAIPTVLFVANADKLQAKQKEILGVEKELEESLERIHESSEPLLSQQGSLSVMTRKNLKRLLDKSTEIEKKLATLRNEMEALRAETRTGAEPSIEVKKAIHPSSILYIDLGMIHMKEMRNGPLRAVFNDGQIRME